MLPTIPLAEKNATGSHRSYISGQANARFAPRRIFEFRARLKSRLKELNGHLDIQQKGFLDPIWGQHNVIFLLVSRKKLRLPSR
ncbi:MAG: hypothetical protein M3O30_11220 [Planctomycetota bacterium]|nr:hypothetical protein [Planctomycetota bacterium]